MDVSLPHQIVQPAATQNGTSNGTEVNTLTSRGKQIVDLVGATAFKTIPFVAAAAICPLGVGLTAFFVASGYTIIKYLTYTENLRKEIFLGIILAQVSADSQKPTEVCSENASTYALRFFKERLESLSNKPVFYLQNLCNRLGINAILHSYFDPVETPQDGDLVVFSQGMLQRAEIYRDNDQKVSKYSKYDVDPLKWFPHPVYRSASFFKSSTGEIAQIFRLRDEARSLPTLPHLPGFCEFNDEGSLVYQKNSENDASRKIYDTTYHTGSHIEENVGIHVLSHFDGIYAKCAHYAMTIALAGREEQITVSWEPTETMEFIRTHFTQTKTPVAGDVAVYFMDGVPVHFGIYVSADCIESKWGLSSVIRHAPFLVPHPYGDTINFYRLQESSFSPVLQVSAA